MVSLHEIDYSRGTLFDLKFVAGDLPGSEDIMRLVASQRHTLDKEVQKFCAERDV